MKRMILAACLLSAPGLAAGQSGGVIIVGGPIEVAPPIIDSGTVVTPGDFQPIFSVDIGPVFPVRDFTSMLNAAARQDAAPAFPVAPDPGMMLRGQAPIVTIEEEGVRLPAEQFTLP